MWKDTAVGDDALAEMKSAARLNPSLAVAYCGVGDSPARLFAGQFQSASEWAQRATRVPRRHYWPFAHRVSALGRLQEVDVMRAATAELLQRRPDFSCDFARRRLFDIKNGRLKLYAEGLRRAGISS